MPPSEQLQQMLAALFMAQPMAPPPAAPGAVGLEAGWDDVDVFFLGEAAEGGLVGVE